MLYEVITDVLDSFPTGFLDAIGFTDVFSAAGYVGSTTFGLLGLVRDLPLSLRFTGAGPTVAPVRLEDVRNNFV